MTARQPIVIDLIRVDEGGRHVEPAPDGISIGALTLRSWEVHPIMVSPEVSDDRDCYLIKVNHELDLVSGSVVNWYQAGLAFEGQAIVIDALPRRSRGTVDERTYTLTDKLLLVPYSGGPSAHAHLPTMTESVDVFGIGGRHVSWSRLADTAEGVSPGSQVSWVVVLVPKGSVELPVTFTVRYALPVGKMIDDRPAHQPERFVLRLKDGLRSLSAIEPSWAENDPAPDLQVGPSAFICYAHDSEEHIELVNEFASLLTTLGVNVHIDKSSVGPRKDWGIWSLHCIEDTDYTLIAASPKCKAAGDGRLSSDQHPGIQSELNLIREKIHRFRDIWTPKVLPVILPGETKDDIPSFLQPYSVDHYPIHELTERGVGELLKAMGRSDSGEWPPASPVSETEPTAEGPEAGRLGKI